MSPKRRVLAAAFLAALAFGGLTGLAALCGKPQKEPLAKPSRTIVAAAVALKAKPPPALLPQAPANAVTPPKEEQPIEEVLLESGENPGAVFYTSRIREALREGNPSFARELLRQMREEHESSILIEEAERLFDERKKP